MVQEGQPFACIPSQLNSIHIFSTHIIILVIFNSIYYYHTSNRRTLKSPLAWNFPTKSPCTCLILFIRATYKAHLTTWFVQPKTIFGIAGPKLWTYSLRNVPSILLFLTSEYQLFSPAFHSQRSYDTHTHTHIYIYIYIYIYDDFTIFLFFN